MFPSRQRKRRRASGTSSAERLRRTLTSSPCARVTIHRRGRQRTLRFHVRRAGRARRSRTWKCRTIPQRPHRRGTTRRQKTAKCWLPPHRDRPDAPGKLSAAPASTRRTLFGTSGCGPYSQHAPSTDQDAARGAGRNLPHDASRLGAADQEAVAEPVLQPVLHVRSLRPVGRSSA